MSPAVTVLHHLGNLHPYETVMVLLIAFGPFLVIAGLVLRERRRAAREPGEAGASPTGDQESEPR